MGEEGWREAGGGSGRGGLGHGGDGGELCLTLVE